MEVKKKLAKTQNEGPVGFFEKKRGRSLEVVPKITTPTLEQEQPEAQSETARSE